MHPANLAASHLAAIVEASEDAIISKTLDGRILTWNAAAERVYGYPAAEAIGQPMTLLLPPDRPDEEASILDRIRHGIRVDHFETVRKRKDGRLIDVSLTISPIRDEGGRIIGASHIARDITERKQAEALIRDNEAKLRAYLESAPQGVITVDAVGRIELVNGKIEELFGYTRQELIGHPPELLVPSFSRIATAEGDTTESSGMRSNRSEFPIEVSIARAETKTGKISIVVINDISERKHVDEQLRQTQKLESLGVLAGGVAHDFNNLLTGILGNVSLALEQLSTNHPVRQPLRSALTASERAADLTKQLLAYAGKGRFVIEAINLSILIREISELIQTSIPRTVQLRLELMEDLPVVEADASQLQQLIMNLVINGAEAIGEDRSGTVLVTTGVQDVDEQYIHSTFGPKDGVTPGQYVTLQVHDSGVGMNDEVISRIFDPFFTTKFTGRGLGLAAVQGIVRGHKGTLKVYSQPGKGTTFKVLLPVSNRVLPENPRRPSAEALSGDATVLVIDDEQIVRQTAKAMLERYGYTVLLAENGREGVDLFRVLSDKVGLVILDMTMPVMSGEETLRNLKLINPQVRVLLSS
jgi:PAS domain S-box-containing protein